MNRLFLSIAALAMACSATPRTAIRGGPGLVAAAYPAGSAVEKHGALRVQGTKLVDRSGAPLQLRGVSSHGLQWYPQFMNASAFAFMAERWHVNVVRAAMYVTEGGYLTNPVAAAAAMDRTVEAAAQAGVYAIVDWHISAAGSNDPMKHLEEAKAFFAQAAARYAGRPHVLYELCNEPSGDDVTWMANVKPYAKAVIPVIRAKAPDAVVIVGTTTFSQDVDLAADFPLELPNVMYALHIYAGTHGQSLRDRAQYAVDHGAALLVTEIGTVQANGDGDVNAEETEEWMKFFRQHQIGWTNWSLADKAEGASILKPGASPQGGWSDADLTPSGLLVKKYLLAP
jgi:endoglucanase